MTIAFLV